MKNNKREERYSKAYDEFKKKYLTALDEALDNNNHEEAVKILNTLLEIFPDNPQLLLLLGRCYLNLDKPINALLTLKKCKVEPSYEAELLTMLGVTYEELYLNELAIQVARRLIEIGEGSEEVYSSLAKILSIHGYANEAIKVAKEGLAINHLWDDLRYLLGMTYLYLKENQEALTILKQLKENGYPFAQNLSELIEKDDPEVDKVEIIEEKRQAEEHVLRAWQLLRYGEKDRAIRELIDALIKNGDLAIAYTRLGYIYDNYGLLDEGLTLHKQATEKDPNCAEAYNNMGYVFQVKEDIQKAIEAYTKALEIDPNFVPAHNSLGCLYDTFGDYEKGIAHFKQALKIDPNRAITWHNLGYAYKASGKIDDAVAAYKTAIKFNPKSLARTNLAKIYRELKRYEDAKAELLEFLKIDPECLVAWFELALCYMELGEKKKFHVAIERAMVLPARDPIELFEKAQFMDVFDKEKAIEFWTQFLIVAEHHFVEPDWISYAKKRLAELTGSTH